MPPWESVSHRHRLQFLGSITQYNHHRYHESLNNLTPADVYFGRAKEVLNRREKIKRDTLAARRFMAQQTRLAAGL